MRILEIYINDINISPYMRLVHNADEIAILRRLSIVPVSYDSPVPREYTKARIYSPGH